MSARLKAIAKKVLPARFVHWYRRRRVIHRYLNELGFELYDRQVRMQLEDLEGRIAARRDGFYAQLVKDVLDRTDLVLQELDRRIEGLSARHGRELRRLRDEVAGLKASVAAIAAQTNAAIAAQTNAAIAAQTTGAVAEQTKEPLAPWQDPARAGAPPLR